MKFATSTVCSYLFLFTSVGNGLQVVEKTHANDVRSPSSMVRKGRSNRPLPSSPAGQQHFDGLVDSKLSRYASTSNRKSRSLRHREARIDHHELHAGDHTELDQAEEHHFHRGAHDGFERGKRRQADFKRNRKESTLYPLPEAQESHFNQTLYDSLLRAPFEVYEDALGHSLEESEYFPIFKMPIWHNTTGIFSAFSKAATPMIFETKQILMGWSNILDSSYIIPPRLLEFIENSNLRASLIIGRHFGDSKHNQYFVALIITYFQFGVEKNVLVPLGRIEDFFEESNSFFNLKTHRLEHELLKDTTEAGLDSNFTAHALMDIRNSRQTILDDLELKRFRQLFQVLVRRGSLFTLGYADCLHNSPYHLRDCLHDVFEDIVHRETETRGALDESLVGELHEIHESLHARVDEVCINVQGGANDYFGSGSCYTKTVIRDFVHSSFV